MQDHVTTMDRLRLYLDILRYKRKKRYYDLINDDYDLGVWNQNYEDIDFEKWLGNYGIDGNQIRVLVVSSAYLRLLIFLLAILIPACGSSSLAFLMMYSAYKLNKQGDNIQP